jgi:DNA mismatch repair ATPase MutS
MTGRVLGFVLTTDYYAFPELLAGAENPELSAVGLGHPLIAATTRVCNDLRLGADCRLLVVTGSKMSGKSTFGHRCARGTQIPSATIHFRTVSFDTCTS